MQSKAAFLVVRCLACLPGCTFLNSAEQQRLQLLEGLVIQQRQEIFQEEERCHEPVQLVPQSTRRRHG
jgi:hypothetical protein